MVKLFFKDSKFNDKQKEIITYVWNHFVKNGFSETVFDHQDTPPGHATTIVKNEYKLDHEFYVRPDFLV